MKKVILISGYKDSGKSFVAELLSKMFQSQVFAFADPMKDILCTTLSISKDDLNRYKKNADEVLMGSDFNGHNHTDMRTIIQRFGSEAMKSMFGDMVWTDLMVERIERESKLDDYVIVSDWRFIDEYIGVAEAYDVITVRVDDHDLNAGEHSSEHQLDTFNFDYRFNNTGHDGDIHPQIRALTTLILANVI